MFTSKFSQIRNSMHAFSRAPLAKGQKWLDQATAPAGHNISFENVRAEKIPTIESIEERDADNKYLVAKTDGKRIVGGSEGSKYVDVIKFIDKYKLMVIDGTNNESYFIVDEHGTRQSNFIDPADAPISQCALSEGYELLMFASDGTTKISRNVGWTFDSFNGIIHFEGANPKSPLSEWPYGEPVVEGFIYIGKKVSALMEEFSDNFDYTADQMAKVSDSAIAIQPFKFSTSEMTTIGSPYPIENSHIPDLDYFQCLSISIPGYVFDLVSLDDDETVITEMRHLPNGDTQIFLNLPWNIQYNRPIMDYQYDTNLPEVGRRIAILGKYKFIAMTFVTNDGRKVPLKQVIDFENPANAPMIPPIPFGYETAYPIEKGDPINTMAMPPRPQRSSGFPGGFISDDDTIVNVFNTQRK